MDIPINRLKAALATRTPQFGIFSALVEPVVAEINASSGFDFVMLDMEHATNDPRTVLTQLQAMAPYPTSVSVRVPEGEPVIIKRVLDVGAQTIVVPMVESADQAAALVDAVRYPPRGIRGVGPSMARAARWNRVGSYLTDADEQVCLICQVESVAGVEHAAEIAAVPGVDCVFVGPSDLAASMGHIGQAGHPDVQAAVAATLDAIAAAGNASGVFATTVDQAKQFAAEGVTVIAVGADISLLAKATAQLAADLRS
jgi:4-hydroxy-2-oxoheptanedioate aldolase